MTWVEILVAMIFGPPLLAGVVLLIGGCWWLDVQQKHEMDDGQEVRHAES